MSVFFLMPYFQNQLYKAIKKISDLYIKSKVNDYLEWAVRVTTLQDPIFSMMGKADS